MQALKGSPPTRGTLVGSSTTPLTVQQPQAQPQAQLSPLLPPQTHYQQQVIVESTPASSQSNTPVQIAVATSTQVNTSTPSIAPAITPPTTIPTTTATATTTTATSTTTATLPVVAVAQEKKKLEGVGLYRAKLIVPTTAATVVDYYIQGGKYGHPELFRTIYTSTNLTNGGLVKLKTPDSETGKILLGDTTPGLHFIHSDCYHIPDVLIPADMSKPGGGESGVVVKHFSKIRTKPNSIILLSAAEQATIFIIRGVVEQMIRGDGKTVVKHNMSLETLGGFFRDPTSSFVSMIGGFFRQWKNIVSSQTLAAVERPGKNPIPSKTIWLPAPIEWKRLDSGSGLSLTDKFVIDNIIETYRKEKYDTGKQIMEINRKKGLMVRKPKAPKPSKTDKAKTKKIKAKASVEAGIPTEQGEESTTKKQLRSPLDIAVKEAKKALATAGVDPELRRVRVTDPLFKIDQYLTHPKFVRTVVNEYYGVNSPVGGIESPVKRFFDDLLNRLMVAMSEVAVHQMKVADTASLTREIALSTVSIFFASAGLGGQSEVQRLAIEAAMGMIDMVDVNIELAKGKRLTAKKDGDKAEVPHTEPK